MMHTTDFSISVRQIPLSPYPHLKRHLPVEELTFRSTFQSTPGTLGFRTQPTLGNCPPPPKNILPSFHNTPGTGLEVAIVSHTHVTSPCHTVPTTAPTPVLTSFKNCSVATVSHSYGMPPGSVIHARTWVPPSPPTVTNRNRKSYNFESPSSHKSPECHSPDHSDPSYLHKLSALIKHFDH